MAHSLRFPYRVISIFLFLSLTCGFLLAQTAVPVTAAAPTPTPIPTLVPTEDITAPVMPAAQPAAPWRLKGFQEVVLDYVKMTDLDNGWAISGPNLLTTYNGGLSWLEASPPEPIPEGSQAVVYAAFYNAKIAWAIYSIDGQISADSFVWHTTDAGRTWTPGPTLGQQVFGDRLWAEFFALDPLNVWVMIRGVITETGSNYTTGLFRTSDGGLSWNFLPSDSGDNYTGIVFSDATFGVRTMLSADPYDNVPPGYEMTIDGGATWTKRLLPAPPDEPNLFSQYAYCETFQPVATSFPSFRLLVGCFDNLNPHQQFEGYYYSSKNGGSTWIFSKLPAKARADTDQLVYFDAKKIYLLGKHSYYSVNDGMKWADLKVVNWDGQFSFVDPVHGWAIARLQKAVSLVKTTNKAYTWKIILPKVVR